MTRAPSAAWDNREQKEVEREMFSRSASFASTGMRKEEIAYSTQTVYNESQVRKQKGANTPWKDF